MGGEVEDTAIKEFWRVVNKFRRKNKVSFAEAFIQVRRIEPDLFKAYCEGLERQRQQQSSPRQMLKDRF